MNNIHIDREQMTETLKRPKVRTSDLARVLNRFSADPDGGAASEEISVLVQIVLESAGLAVQVTEAACVAANEAITGQYETEQDVVDFLNKFEVEEAS